MMETLKRIFLNFKNLFMNNELTIIEILDNDNLLRRVLFLNPNFIKPDGSIASSCFQLKKNEEGLSVDIERLTKYEKSIQDIHKFRLYSLKAEFIHSLNLKTVHNPLESNYAHALIKGKITRAISRKLAKKATRIPYPV